MTQIILERIKSLILNPLIQLLLFSSIIVGLVLCLRPPFFTFDSYHYLDLSLSPRIGDIHPIAFGFLLRFWAFVAGLFQPTAFSNLVIVWNSFCLSFFLFFPLKKALFNPAAVYLKMTQRFKACYLALVSLSIFILISNLLLVNAFWSEMTGLLELAVMVYASVRYIRTGHLRWMIVGVVVFVISYHTRYLMVILPACLLLVLSVGLVRAWFLSRANGTERNLRMLLMTISMVAALLGANLILQKTLPHRTGEDVSIGAGISLSMQCVLRCGTKMYEIDCTTPEGTKIIEGSLCRDIVVGLVDLGEPMAKYSDLEGIFRQNGLKNSIVWFFKAPLTYVTDIHSVEVGLFAFGEQEDAVLRYPFVKDHYGKYFDANRQSLDASPTFALLQQFITVLFHWYVYHVLTVVLLILCSIILFKSRNDHASLFAAYAIGTYLLFSYFNPHVPYRYLMQIISPAFLALVLYLYEKMTEDAQLIRNSP